MSVRTTMFASALLAATVTTSAQQPGPTMRSDAERRTFTAEAKLLGLRAESRLQICLTPIGGAKVEMAAAGTPWGSRNSTLLVAAPANSRGNKILAASLPYGDPNLSRMVTLEPGKAICGTIELNKRFKGLAHALDSGDVLIFWAYQYASAGVAPELYGGVLGIRGTGPSLPPLLRPSDRERDKSQ